MTPSATDHDWISPLDVIPFERTEVYGLFEHGGIRVVERHGETWLARCERTCRWQSCSAPKRWKPIELTELEELL